MNRAVQVSSIDALEDFHVALNKFVERARVALVAVDLGSRRELERIRHDQKAHWKREIRRREEKVSQAKIELNRLKISGTVGHRPDTIEQEKLLRLSKNRLLQAQEKLEAVRKWGRIVEKAIEEYVGKARRLSELIEGNPPPMVASLKQSIRALDAYVDLEPSAENSEKTPNAEPSRSEDHVPGGQGLEPEIEG